MTSREKYNALIKACGNDDELMQFVLDAVNSLEEYVRSVYTSELERAVVRRKYTGAELRAELERLDADRHTAHEAAIASVRQLNRLADNLGTPVLFEGDPADRIQVAGFCLAFTKEIFDTRTL